MNKGSYFRLRTGNITRESTLTGQGMVVLGQRRKVLCQFSFLCRRWRRESNGGWRGSIKVPVNQRLGCVACSHVHRLHLKTGPRPWLGWQRCEEALHCSLTFRQSPSNGWQVNGGGTWFNLVLFPNHFPGWPPVRRRSVWWVGGRGVD